VLLYVLVERWLVSNPRTGVDIVAHRVRSCCLTSLGYEKFERRDDLDLVFGAMKLVEMIFDELSYQKGTRAAALVVAQARD
jgi:hypothetical protein